VTVEFQDVHKYQAVCENCGHKSWIAFDKAALQEAAPRLLAACVLLVGTVVRDTPAAQVGSLGQAHVEKALKAIAAATGYSQDSWEKLTQEIKQVTQEVRQISSD
jgi:stage V sporulation protein SpoVS